MFDGLRNRVADRRLEKKLDRRAKRTQQLKNDGVDVCIAHAWRPAVVIILASPTHLVPLCQECYFWRNHQHRYKGV